MSRLVLTIPLAAGLGLALAGRTAGQQPDPRGLAFFEAKIRPVLVNHCFECHSAKAARIRGGLLLDSRDGLRDGGETGPAIVPGQPENSLLIKALRHDGLKMPPKKKLPDQVVQDFVAWVKMGAPDPRSGEAKLYKRMTAEEAKTFWAFVPPSKPSVPSVRQTAWVRNDIDRFILAQLESKGLTPARDANRHTLIRRLSFDLTGLPPTPEEVEAFVNDKADRALEKLVDRLLASPRFGERWGRHWLDLARYAESNGNADNVPFPNAWRYRDYVIAAFNKDLPYDRFITEQIAGDLLPASTKEQKDEQLIATGFLALTSKPRAQNNPDFRMDLIADQIDVTTRAVLGLTVLCARCHDHKFDAISTREYYALAGIFDSSEMLAGSAVRGGGGRRAGGVNGAHSLSDGGAAMGVREGRVADCQVCIRGESQKRGERVPRGFLAVASRSPAPAIPSGQSGRLQLAQWLTARDNPLTARVAVNRIWLHLFGQGLVRSPDNFGALGERPTHPQLLDWLAVKFMQDGWSVKKMIRTIVLSRAYQMSSEHDAGNYKADPDNLLVWRANVRRLQAEAIRDAVLQASGQLDLTPPKGSLLGAATGPRRRGNYATAESNKRSVYLAMPRGSALPESLSVFDVANPNLVVAQREVTTVPAQALYLMNSKFILEQSKHLADRLLKVAGLGDAERVDLAYRLTLARPATDAEKARASRYQKAAEQAKESPAQAWATFCQALLASAEFRYLD